MPEKQEPIDGLEACRVRFVGMSLNELDDAPEIDDEMTFAVTAVCTGRGKERMKDGEMRVTARMEVRSLTAVSGPTKPTAAPSLFSVEDEQDEDDE